jgi:Protein of unknown function (DUF4239)
MALFDQPWTMFVVLFVVLFAVVEIGYRIALIIYVNVDQLRHEQLVGARDGITVLLSLLLGFTLAMALTRFEQRKQLIVDEANAIGTISLRTQLLPDSFRDKMRDLLRQYVDERMRFSRAALNGQEFQQALARGKQLQNEMWQQGVEVARQSPTPVNALFLQALNDCFDMSEKRMAALENRVPPAIWVMLTLIALLTCLTVGLTVRRRFWYVMTLGPLMIAIVMALIADLNSPRSGFIQVNRQSIERLQQDLQIGTGGS